MKIRMAIGLFYLTGFISPVINPFAIGMDYIEEMFFTWEDRWPKNLQFDQRVTIYANNLPVKQSIWHEIINSPAKLHIRFDGFESGKGVVFLDDHIYSFENGVQTERMYRINQSLLLGFDIYHQDPRITKQKLGVLGIDFSQWYEFISHDGTTCVVVGATDTTDLTTPQFWIDKEQLYLVKVITASEGKCTSIQFYNYQLICGFPVATTIVFHVNNELFMKEEYYNIVIPSLVDPLIFDPALFATTKW